MPLADPEGFAHRLDEACDRVILDHYLIGDGSPGGLRTRRTDFVRRLEGRLRRMDVARSLWEFRDLLEIVMGPFAGAGQLRGIQRGR